jgi:uncharacterized UBP type Zn finger protein
MTHIRALSMSSTATHFLKHEWGLQVAHDLKKPNIEFSGLRNHGCTCYLNSLLQQLYMIPAFRNAVLSLPTPAPPAAGTPTAQLAGDEAARSLLYQLQHMFGYLQARSASQMPEATQAATPCT